MTDEEVDDKYNQLKRREQEKAKEVKKEREMMMRAAHYYKAKAQKEEEEKKKQEQRKKEWEQRLENLPASRVRLQQPRAISSNHPLGVRPPLQNQITENPSRDISLKRRLGISPTLQNQNYQKTTSGRDTIVLARDNFSSASQACIERPPKASVATIGKTPPKQPPRPRNPPPPRP